MKITKPFIRITGIFTSFVTAALLCFAPMTTAKAEDGAPIGAAVCIAKKTMDLRSEPSASASVVAKLPACTFVDVYAQSGDWYQVEYGGTMAWGSSSTLVFEDIPKAGAEETDSYTLYRQSDPQWRFSRSVAKKACIISSYAMVMSNMGIAVNPRFIYESNRRNTMIKPANLTANFGVVHVSAIGNESPYFGGFDGQKTYIADPANNGAAAIKEALDRNPEGVVCYFKKGGKAHAIVACKYEDDVIYYSDAGRSTDTLIAFEDTWVSYKHKLTYKNLNYIVALDTVE